MHKAAKNWMLMALASMVTLVSACNSETSTSSPAPANGGDSKAPVVTNGSKEEGDPYLGKYDPPVEITTVRIVNDTVKYAEGENIDNNVWTKTLMDKLGLKIKNLWVVSGDQPGGQGEQKMNVSIASGDLPEIIPVNAKQLKQLYESDQLMDLTKVYDKYASPFLKEILNQDGPKALASATFDGKLMAIPNTGSSIDGAAMVWIRSDWLKKLNLQPPKTMNDVMAISEAFTTKDPNSNGKNNTIGLAINKDLYGGYADLTGFFNGYHAYPKTWIKDTNGNLVYGSIQPEMKTALAKLQELYKSGQIDKEFGVKDGGKEGELSASGKVGMHFGQMWNPLWPLVDNKKNDPNAEWQSYPLVSVDDKPATPQVSLSVGGYYAVLKTAKHPEALLKGMNLFVETGWGKTTTPENYAKHFTSNGFERFKYMPFQAWPSRKNLDIHLHMTQAIESKDTSKLNAEEKDINAKISDYLEGKSKDPNGWAYERIFGKTGSFVVINKYVSEKLLKQNEFFGAPTPTMVEKDSTLQKRELEMFTKIIMGDPIDSFDKYVEDWKKLGGDQITKEVNDWAKKMK